MSDIKQELHQSEERFRLLVNSVIDYAIFMLDPAGTITSWNAGAQRLTQYSESEVIGQHFSIFYPPEERTDKPEVEIETARREGRFEEEGLRTRKDGSTFWANVVLTLMYDSRRELIGFAKVIRDLTASRQADEELRQSEERLNLMITSVQDYAIFMLSPTGHIQTWNVGAQRLKGYSKDEIIGKHFSIFYEEHERFTKPPMELEVATRVGRYEEEGWRLRKDGSRFWANVVITALYGPDRSLRGFAKLTRDMTERRKSEEARLKLEQERIARAEAERANRVKDEFLAVISHELRTPLTPIIGWARMLQSQKVTPDQAHALKIIERNANNQVKLIEDLLDISSIVSGKIKLDLKRTSLIQVVQAAIDALRPSAEQKNIVIQMVVEGKVGHVNGDLLRLQQIFWNLLSNAVKFTPEAGVIDVRLRRVDKIAEVIVKDSGEGIPAEYIPHIFERFSQFDTSPSRKHSGMGIGLYVVHQMVRLHGGTIKAESEGEGKGTSFTVELPLMEETAPGHVRPSPSSKGELLRGKVVLVVDDEDDAREYISYVIRQCGADVFVASSAAEAFKKLKTMKIDVLVSDIGMPGEDGFQLLKKIRHEGLGLPVIAVTAFARGEDTVRTLDAGFARHIPKPVNPNEMCAAVAEVAKA